jgi:hypothetical protein
MARTWAISVSGTVGAGAFWAVAGLAKASQTVTNSEMRNPDIVAKHSIPIAFGCK